MEQVPSWQSEKPDSQVRVHWALAHVAVRTPADGLGRQVTLQPPQLCTSVITDVEQSLAAEQLAKPLEQVHVASSSHTPWFEQGADTPPGHTLAHDEVV